MHHKSHNHNYYVLYLLTLKYNNFLNLILSNPPHFFSILKDPFSSFGGKGSTQRFKKNADNLGKLVLIPVMKITNSRVDYNYKSENNIDETKETQVEGAKKEIGNIDDIARTYDCVRVSWIFSSKLNFPWKPVLAAAGETFHYLDPFTGLIVRYEETWKSKPWDVVKRLFIPTKEKND